MEHPELLKDYPITVLLVDDQQIIAEAVKRMLADQPGIVFHYCNDPAKALQMATEVSPTVILQDLVMPDIDGLMLVRYFRANPATHDVPLIVLSTKEEPTIKAEAFALGANDYVVKLPDKLEMIARIRYHSKGYISLLQRNEAYAKLQESQRKLGDELKDAARYVFSLLPETLQGDITTSWTYIPCTSLGGDAFGYHWVDDTHFAIYLLDVCGHGVGAALLSISAMNVLRSQTLSHTNFLDPGSVLKSLNDAFPMEKHNNMFFTMWYGVYNKLTRELVYASGGHPPAILITGDTEETAKPVKLKTAGLVIGGMSDMEFETGSITVGPYNKLYVFSDGVYELDRKDGTMLQIDEFIDVLTQKSPPGKKDLDRILEFGHSVYGEGPFLDDFSIVEATFR
jgi:sigma-B regulation protein RsbU (phosphoserine phosphatase)